VKFSAWIFEVQPMLGAGEAVLSGKTGALFPCVDAPGTADAGAFPGIYAA
jgi:hypothetical protein